MFKQIDNFTLFILIITLHGFLLSALMAIGQLIVNRKSLKNLLFFGLFINFALFEIHFLLFEAGILHNYPFLHQIYIPAMYLLGPLIYLFSRFSLQKDFKFKKSHLLHFIPLFLSIAAIIYAVTQFPAQNMRFMDGYFYNVVTLWIGAGASMSFLVYLIWIGFIISKNAIWKPGVMKKSPSAILTLLIFLFFSIAWITDLLAALTNQKIFMEVSTVILNLVIIFLFLINFRYPLFYQTLQEIVEEEKQKRSYLGGINVEQIHSELCSLMKDEELFLDEDLSLSSLAERMGITTHQLSQFLNEKLGRSFTTFVNEYRIDRAKTLLLEIRNHSILSIAFEVGFKSKSTFNAVFSKNTGMTPSQFRKKYKKNSPML